MTDAAWLQIDLVVQRELIVETLDVITQQDFKFFNRKEEQNERPD